MFIETPAVPSDVSEDRVVTFDATYAEEAEAVASAISTGRILDVLEHILWVYAEVHDISEQEAADMLWGYDASRNMRRRAIVWFMTDYGTFIGTVCRIVEDAGGTNPPLDHPERIGNHVVTRIPDVRGPRGPSQVRRRGRIPSPDRDRRVASWIKSFLMVDNIEVFGQFSFDTLWNPVRLGFVIVYLLFCNY